MDGEAKHNEGVERIIEDDSGSRKKMFHSKTPRRSELQVIADVLEASIDATPSTKILGMANVTRRSFRLLLDGLVSRGLLRKTKLAYSKRFLYQTTKDGDDALHLIRRLRDVLGEDLW